MATTESKVATAILQKSVDIEIDGVTYKVAPPTCETMILYSEEISNVNAGSINIETPVQELARVGPKSRHLFYGIAIMILGPDGLVERRKIRKKNRLGIPYNTYVMVDRKVELGNQLMKKDVNHIANLAATLFHFLDVRNFMRLTISLAELNLLKPTKVVSKKATRSGRSSTVRQKI